MSGKFFKFNSGKKRDRYKEIIDNTENNNSQDFSTVEANAKRIAYMAGYEALQQYARLNYQGNNGRQLKTYIVSDFYQQEEFLHPFDHQTAFSLTRALTKELKQTVDENATVAQFQNPQDRSNCNLPDSNEILADDSEQGLSIAERLYARKKIILGEADVYRFQVDSSTTEAYSIPIKVAVTARVAPQLKNRDLEFLHFVIAPPSFERAQVKLDDLFASIYLNKDKFPEYQEAADDIRLSFEGAEKYCYLKNDSGEYFSFIFDEEGNAEFAFTKSNESAFILNKQAYINSLVQDITTELLAFDHYVAEINAKNANKNYCSFFTPNRCGWFKLTVSGTGACANVLLKLDVSKRIYELFYTAALQAMLQLPTVSQRVIEFPIFGDVSKTAFEKTFTAEVKQQLAKKKIRIEAGVNRDGFDFRHIDQNKYVLGCSAPTESNALVGNALDDNSVEVQMGLNSTMSHTMVWIFNFMKMLSPHNQVQVSVQNGKAVYKTIAEQFPKIASEFNYMNTPKKCNELLIEFVKGVKKYMIAELVHMGWDKFEAGARLKSWYSDDAFEQQQTIADEILFSERLFNFTKAANSKLQELKQQAIPQPGVLDLGELNPQYNM